ncbi:MAG: J domain-containing protein [Pedobacter sp.]|nr:J domain-containing protein [Chitinophagaceae bacterium]
MLAKDYYEILQILPTASLDEIKKAYRKLALQYHPDTATDVALDANKFIEIKEAYEILSDTKKRQVYHYKRFYKNYQQQTVVTPEIILQQTIDLAALVSVLDPFRIDYDKLNHQITQTINANTIKVLKEKKDNFIIQKVVKNCLKTTLLLHYKMALLIHQLLLNLADNNIALITEINHQITQQKRLFYWNKYKLLGTVFFVIILCIYFYTLT